MRWWLVVAVGLWACDDGGGTSEPVEPDSTLLTPDSTVPDAAPDVAPDGPLPDVAEPDAGVDAQPDMAPPPDHPNETPPETDERDGVVRTMVSIAGVEAPPNPETGGATPAELNRAHYARYHAVGEPAPHAIVVGMPGILAGSGSLDALARALVKRAAEADRPIEVWAIDRRSNPLEDLRGVNTAEVAADPEIAWRYYFGDQTIDGAPFGDFVEQGAVDYMSEWGLAVHVGDVRQIMQQIPQPLRRGHVFLMGHSLGAMFAEIYAGWRFEDGTTGAEELAGLILVDGAPLNEPVTEEEWREGSALGFFALPGVDTQRARGPRFLEIPLVGATVFVLGEIMGLRILEDPEGVVADPQRDRLLGLLSTRPANALPQMTNEAALGMAFGFDFMPLAFAKVRSGTVDGPVETYTNLVQEEGIRPADKERVYGWIDALDADPPGFTPIALFAEGFTGGRSNFAEWYFPLRLSADINAAAGAGLAEESWQVAQGLTATAGPQNDAPIISIAGDLFRVPEMTGVKERVAPTVGEGRPAAGATRDEPEGWTLIDATFMGHLDVTMAADAPGNPVPAAVDAFIERHTAEGTIE